MALTDTKLKNLKPTDKVYKVVDRDGMYVVVSIKGTLTFRYDYRLAGRRETLTLGQYDEFQASQPKRAPRTSSTEIRFRWLTHATCWPERRTWSAEGSRQRV